MVSKGLNRELSVFAVLCGGGGGGAVEVKHVHQNAVADSVDAV